MKLTLKSDYCLRVLIYLQKNKKNNQRVKIQEIADEYQISKNHLSVVVNTLSDLGYITTYPGPQGGIEFNEKYSNNNVGDLINQVEDFDVVECFDPKNSTCTLTANCHLKGILKKATQAFLSELKKYKISDLA